mmetsp:Transcript_12168/g.21805  ORF Transcript_12168/g.21805 Transcript_12168/m.21805 type:complete len:80 (+) Transcript_12168:1381-1620(+)
MTPDSVSKVRHPVTSVNLTIRVVAGSSALSPAMDPRALVLQDLHSVGGAVRSRFEHGTSGDTFGIGHGKVATLTVGSAG